MTIARKIAASAIAVALGATTLAANAKTDAEQNDGRLEIGYLNCDMVDGANFVVYSSQEFVCSFQNPVSNEEELYAMEIRKYGVDLSVTDDETLRWAVVAPSTFEEKGVLEGRYGGASADAALGYSLGARALVGGGDNSIALQPVSVSTGEGLGAAVGIEQMKLTFKGAQTKA